MKRTFALLIVVLMCFALFMGCSGDGDDTTSIKKHNKNLQPNGWRFF